MNYTGMLTCIISIVLSMSVFAQDMGVRNVKITDIYPVEQNSQYNGFFKQGPKLGLTPIHTLGGLKYENTARNFLPSLSLHYAGDLNGDGYDDFYYRVVASDETTDDLDDRIRKTIVLYGSPSGIDDENSTVVRDGYTFLADVTGDGQPESIQYRDGALYLVVDESNGALETLVDVSLLELNYSAEYRAHGDFNGDGFNDLMVYNNTVNSMDATEVFMIYGASNVANITIDTLYAIKNGTGSYTEYSQMAYSDINGDGITEIIRVLSGTNSDNEAYGNIMIHRINGAGELEVVSTDTLWDNFWLAYTMRNGEIGLSDLNGDGLEELHLYNDGLLNVYQLSTDTTLSFDTDNPILTNEVNGFSSLGDFDDNGTEDLLIYSNDFVKYISSDASFNLTETDLPMQDGDYVWPSQSVTEDVNSGGDVNGDGIRDIVVGFENAENQRYGYRVHFGNSSGSLTDTATTEIEYIMGGETSTVRYVFNAGDFNNDGKEDFGVTYASGKVELYLESAMSNEMTPNLSVIYNATVFSPSTGDVNGDGIDDVLISISTIPTGSNDAAINIYLGGSTPDLDSDYSILFSDIYPDTTDGTLSNAQFIGDINHDGFDDIMFTSELMEDVTHIIYGGNTLSATPDEQLPYFAMNFSKLGDFNGDGLADFAVANNSNRVFIYSGFDASAGGSFSDQPMLELAAPDYNGVDQFGFYSFYGHSITSGDFNGDGLADLAFSSAFHQEYINGAYRSAEAIRLYAGSTSPDTVVDGKIYLLADDYALMPPNNMEDTLSQNIGTISSVPDQNNDGKDELLFAGYGWSTNAGVYYGGDLDTMGTTIDVYLEAPNQNAGLGPFANYIYAARGIPAVGDFNNDGKNDYILPQIGDRNFKTDPIYIYSSDQFSVANEEELTAVSEFELHQNYPNPFNPTTKISYNLPVSGDVKLQVFDITGRLVSTVVDKRQVSGNHVLSFDASTLASGIYIYRLKASGLTQTRKMTLIK